ncbi:RNase H domain-containing protein [Apiospora saccharicola]|uniref:RNase H domain-containing protein n=1 Tax=Apiospora saccharicola TaxID=335842 RepID=A0ABR1VNY2_9PEZI
MGENAAFTMSLEEPGDAMGPGADDWGRQTCHVSWLTRCMRHCAEQHKECHADPAHHFDAPVYFIDCDNRRLCEAAPDMAYTALSYVWGKERPDDGALDLDYFAALPALLPLTVENAITLTRQLGIRYLWVDRYCISKSEEDSTIRHDQLRTMDQIYGQAELTIVSLGDDPQTGLPGVHGTPRWVRPMKVIRGYTFRTTFRDPRRVILASKWNERGWTYQEACLSRRKIYFTPEEAVFECNVAYQSEIEDCWPPLKPLALEDFRIMRFKDPLFTTVADRLDGRGLLDHINVYCRRQLTYQSDALNAFQGVIGKHERGPYAIQHHWGVPIYEQSAEEENEKIPLSLPKLALKQQLGSREIMAGESTLSKFAAGLTWGFTQYSTDYRRRSEFPSWSWTGWEPTKWERAMYSPVYKSSDIGDMSIWIELRNQEIRCIDSFSSAGAFNLPPSRMYPYIHIEGLTAHSKIRFGKLGGTDSGGTGLDPGKRLPDAEFQRSDGSRVLCTMDAPNNDELVEGTECKAILFGGPATKYHGLIFIMMIKEKSGFYERIGSISSSMYAQPIWTTKRADVVLLRAMNYGQSYLFEEGILREDGNEKKGPAVNRKQRRARQLGIYEKRQLNGKGQPPVSLAIKPTMPLGWYLAQGLDPLGPDSSDDDEGPCELPDGRLVCGPHGLVRCWKCLTDYSYTNGDDEDDEEDEEDDEDEDDEDVDEENDENEAHSPTSSLNERIKLQIITALNRPSSGETEKRRGTGRVFPVKFCPPSPTITPAELFSGRRAWMRAIRHTHRNDPGMLLLFTDGACLNNGQANPKAGWAFVHHAGTGPNDPANVAKGRLEAKGPFGDDSNQTSNRAELRAVIAALRFRHWSGENFHTVVIATDSEYVVEGSTVWVKNWVKNEWKSKSRAPVKNRDLWEMLLGEVERWKEHRLDIQFWRISRKWNVVADAAAKKAAEGPDVDKWMEMIGMAI